MRTDSFTTRPLHLFLGSFVGLFGCGDGASPPAATATDALEADIGPAGGTLQGAPGTVFQGVRLQIPAGALATTTRVRVVPTLDETPLPELAVRVGPQFQLEPATTTLSQPARWSLPVGLSFRDVIRGGMHPVKVWLRDGEGWTLTEPASASATSADIEIRRFTVGAAGVRVDLSVPPRGCATTGTCVNLTNCTPTGGLCVGGNNVLNFTTSGVGAIGALLPRAHPSMGGEAVTFVAQVGSPSQWTVGRVFLPANTPSFGTQLLGTGPLGPLPEAGFLSGGAIGANPAREVGGDSNTVLVGRLSAAPTGQTTFAVGSVAGTVPTITSTPSAGNVNLRDGRTVILRRNGSLTALFANIDGMFVRQTTGQVGTFLSLPGGTRSLLGMTADPSAMDAFWLVTSASGSTPVPVEVRRMNAAGQVLATATLPPNLLARFQIDLSQVNGGGSPFFTNALQGFAATSQALYLIPLNTATSTPPFVRIALDGSASEAGIGSVDTLTFGTHLEMTADLQGNLWTRSFLSNGSPSIVFHGPNGAGPSQILQLAGNPFVQNIFPSSTQGIFALVRPSSGADRRLAIVQVRTNGT